MNIKIISKDNCTECERIKSALHAKGMVYEEENMDTATPSRQFELRNIARRHRQLSMPLIFVDNEFQPASEFEKKHL